MARPERTRTPKSKKMVRKQIYIHPQQERQLKELAVQYDATEAELVRQAIEMLLNQTPRGQGALPFHEASWQEILAFVDEREQNVPSGEPYKWNRADAYDDERAQRTWNTNEDE
jgi:hypothetical protein